MSLSATVSLDRAVLVEVTEDPNITPRYVVAGTSGSIGGGGSSPKADAITLEGSFRTYGNGNTRLILGSSQTRTQTLALIGLDDDDLQIVLDLAGHTICYRDTYGRRIFGAYINPQVNSLPHSGGLSSVSLVIQSVSYTEEV